MNDESNNNCFDRLYAFVEAVKIKREGSQVKDFAG
jgi:hypothetical protein